MWIVKNGVRTRPCDQFYDRLVLKPEMGSNFSWTGPPPWEIRIGCTCWTSSSPWLVCDGVMSSSWPSHMFLSKITSLGSSLFSKVWKGSLKNELSCKLSWRILAQVIGPCMTVGGSAGTSEGVMSSSAWIMKCTGCMSIWSMHWYCCIIRFYYCVFGIPFCLRKC